jgi:hypothetical protein
MARRCPAGKILRKAYTKKSGTRVPASCIKDRGAKGKGKKLFVLRRGTLGKYGYKTALSDSERHVALEKAVRGESYAAVVRKLNAVSILQRRTNPRVYKILRSDMAYLQKKHRS